MPQNTVFAPERKPPVHRESPPDPTPSDQWITLGDAAGDVLRQFGEPVTTPETEEVTPP